MIRKLFSRRGETLTELLISVLVISLGLTMFATAMMAARRMIELGTERVQTYYTARNTLEKEEGGSSASLTIEISSTGTGQNAGNGTQSRAATDRPAAGGGSTVTGNSSYQVKVYSAGSGETIWRYGR